jgi:AcrR family transcriptional regulator
MDDGEGTGDRPARRIPWGTLSRDSIVSGALSFVRRRGYEQLTIRALAGELGASPMSLYRHVRDKDDLLDEVVDLLIAEAWLPSAPEIQWKTFVSDAAEGLRALLVREPAVLQVYLRHPVVSPAATSRMEAMLRSFRLAGLTEAGARRAYAAIQTYTVGFAALEAGRAGWKPSGDDPEDLPHQLALMTTVRQFNEGLSYMLEAIEQRALARQS